MDWNCSTWGGRCSLVDMVNFDMTAMGINIAVGTASQRWMMRDHLFKNFFNLFLLFLYFFLRLLPLAPTN